MAKAINKKATVKTKTKLIAKKKVSKREVIIPKMEPKETVKKEETVDVEALLKEQALKVSQEKAEIRLKAGKNHITRPH